MASRTLLGRGGGCWRGSPAPALCRGAATTLTFQWLSTGTDQVVANVGDTVTLHVSVSSDTLRGAGVSVAWDPSRLEAISATECPSPPNLYTGLCTYGAYFLSALVPGVTIDNEAGLAHSFDAYSAYYDEADIVIGEIVFQVESGLPVLVESTYLSVDGISDYDSVVEPYESATIVPEPSPRALFALGLVALGTVGRHRD